MKPIARGCSTKIMYTNYKLSHQYVELKTEEIVVFTFSNRTKSGVVVVIQFST